jgi:hypothetical protein
MGGMKLTELETAWPAPFPLPAGNARIVFPLKSKLLPGHCPHEDTDIRAILKAKEAERKEHNLMQRVKYVPQKAERKLSLKDSRAAERRRRIIQHVAMTGGWIEGTRIGRDLTIDHHTLFADLAVMRKSHVLECKEVRRPDNRGAYKAYRVPA